LASREIHRPLVPSLDEVAEALHRNACERRELNALKRLALARLKGPVPGPPVSDQPERPEGRRG
jgi:hypothetical protein